MNIQQFAIGTLAAIATADLTQEASVSPGGTSPTVPSATPNLVSNSPTSSGDAQKQYADPSPSDREKNRSRDPVKTHSNLPSRDSFRGEMPLQDVQDHWAREFIEALQTRGIIRGFPDGNFRPDAVMTRAEFAVVLQRAFPDRSLASAQTSGAPSGASFADVPENYWAQAAIAAASEMGFLDGYPNRIFEPNEPIPRLQVLVALVKGLNLKAPEGRIGNWDAYFHNPASIPDYAKDRLAGAILLLERLEQHQQQYGKTNPGDWFIHPDRDCTRAEVAAFLYQALAITEQAPSQAELFPQSEEIPDTSDGRNSAQEPAQVTTSLFPDAEDENFSTPVPDFRANRRNRDDRTADKTSPNPLPNPTQFSLQNGNWGRGGEWFQPERSHAADIPAVDVDRREEDLAPKRELAYANVSGVSRRQPHGERSDRLSEMIPADEIVSARELPSTRPKKTAEPLETSISLRLETLRDRIQSTPRNAPDLPPLAAVGTYLPEPGQMFEGYMWPARGVLTSGFGMRWGRMHKGIDIAGPIGTPIVAAATGVVSYARWNSGGYGNLVEIEHPNGTVTRYAHNQRILVSEGQQVTQGQLIAEMGSTGNSTGPHLHFEIYPPGEDAVDPLALLPGDRRNWRVNSTVGQAVR